MLPSVSRRSSPRTLVPLALALAIAVPLAALAQEEEEHEELAITASGAATFSVEGERAPIAFSHTPIGPLVSLPAIVSRLGGTLEEGPLGHGHTLILDSARLVFGPGSAAMTVGREIVYLSQPPRLGPGGIEVPLDLLERAYGEARGIRFRWDARELELRAERRPSRRLPVTIDVVHLQGVSTVVLQFPDTPRYRVEGDGSTVRVRMIGDRLAPESRLPPVDDPLVARVVLEEDEVAIQLVRGAEAEEPYVLQNPYRLVFDVFSQRAAASPPRRPARPRTGGVTTIVVDPGHGGSELGAIGPSGTTEKDIALQLAQSLKNRLESRLPVRVVMTRSEDVNLSLETRTAIANQHRADLFLSIHLNSSVGPRAHGAETYILNMEASDERAARAAAEENFPSGGTVDLGDAADDLSLILWDLAQSRYLAESQRLANLVQEELNEALGLHDRGVKQAPFRVLMGAAMPAILVELGFLSNPEEERLLLDPAHRSNLVDSLVRAVARFRAQTDARSGAGRAPLR